MLPIGVETKFDEDFPTRFVKISAMALNPQYDAIGKAFVQQYYALFDDAAQRHQLTALYNVSYQMLNYNCSS